MNAERHKNLIVLTEAAHGKVSSPQMTRLAEKLCWAACGRSEALDEALGEIIRLLQRAPDADAIDAAIARLTGVIEQAIDGPSFSQTGITAPGELLLLVDRLLTVSAFGDKLRVFREHLNDTNVAARHGLIENIAATVRDYCQALESERLDLIKLVDQMTSSLGELSSLLADDAQHLQAADETNRQWSQQLIGEVSELGDHVGAAKDMDTLRLEVAAGIERIGQSLREARAREEARISDLQQRSERMKSRIERLESETLQLRHSLASEHQSACIDRLTALPNRLAYDLRLNQAMQAARHSRIPLVLAVWDIDFFKNVNDTFGHHAGDKALQTVGRHLAQQLRNSDFCARYGGEEFAMILHNIGPEAALATVERIRRSIANIGFQFRQQPICLTVSCGLTALLPEDSAESVFERADAALYRAKNAGRNRCIVG